VFITVSKVFSIIFVHYSKYYDLKALAEYKLGLKEEANLTLQSANNISLEKYKRPFDSILSVLISLSK